MKVIVKRTFQFTLYAIIGFLVIPLLFLGYNHTYSQTIRSDADYPIMTFEKLEDISQLIIKAKVSNKKTSKVELDNHKIPIDWATITHVEVVDVYKDKSESIKPGDAIPVVEPYADWRSFGGAFSVISGDHYSPLSNGKEYILYLHYFDKYKGYQVANGHQGKYIILSDEKNINKQYEVTDLEINGIDANYLNIYEKVISKYLY